MRTFVVNERVAEDHHERASSPIDPARCAAINKLPPDVLLLIFHQVRYTIQESPDGRIPTIGQDDTHLRPSYQHPTRTYFFSELIASVCRHWREVMSTTSSFWTHLVIWIGEEPTPLSHIRDHLAWSREHLLDICVLSGRPLGAPYSSAMEKAQVDATMELLVPHMQRWKTLCMNVLYSTSLPLPRIDLVGRADNLVELEQLFFDNSAVADAADSSVIREFHTPRLDVLIMSGLHFRESYVKPFPRHAMPTWLNEVKILGYGAHHPAFPVVDLLRCLVSCEVLDDVELADLALDLSYTGPPVLPPASSWTPCVCLVGLPGNIIAEYHRLLDYPFAETISYTRCTMERPARLCEWHSLDLNEINSPPSLLSFLLLGQNRFSGNEVSFTDCDGLVPAVLSFIARPLLGGALWPCATVTRLTIDRCERFRSSHLREVLEARRSAHAATGYAEQDDPGFVVNPITELYVSDCCELDPGDKEWFDANVYWVCWDNWWGGTASQHHNWPRS
ncbi:hypothetical protein EVJ58_g6271 [Rhodofomes roseus]|uniref:Uncharacterized protein n=1 Tax=Rhodofomes roseus TaxID=34475 RepID=A0A4Y9Y829_9APHY|nr:hypothetical protein EVJ58_g6271 [Rhodofomes roseus]